LAPPKIYVFANKAKTAGNVHLTCMATGFYPKDVIIHIKKNGVHLTDKDGVQSSVVIPNDDDAYQIRKSVEIQEADTSNYKCYVLHGTLLKPIVGKWGKRPEKSYAATDLQRRMGETPQIQVCQACSIISKKTRGCNRCKRCFNKVLSKESEYLCKCFYL
uniref:Ig-like domain-containing protein n=1 Tax=Salmo trutta TaxID=8032 RepID=A0A674BKQ5_SALTR